MRTSTAFTVLQLGLVFFLSTKVQGEQLPVNAHMDIYRAGGYDDGSDGIGPAVYVFAEKPGEAIIFSAVVGEWAGAGGVLFGPDGDDACPSSEIITNPTGTFAGYTTNGFCGEMVGMFLNDELPVAARPPLTFALNNSYEGIPNDFRSLSPLIGEVFFIGDGLTGTGTGNHQVFRVPPTATRLFLGYVDSCTRPGPDSPGCYSDNAGTLTAFFAIHDISSDSEFSK